MSDDDPVHIKAVKAFAPVMESLDSTCKQIGSMVTSTRPSEYSDPVMSEYMRKNAARQANGNPSTFLSPRNVRRAQARSRRHALAEGGAEPVVGGGTVSDVAVGPQQHLGAMAEHRGGFRDRDSSFEELAGGGVPESMPTPGTDR